MTATLAHSHGRPSGSPAERFTSRNPDDFPIPTTAQEDWRFSPPAQARGLFQPFEAGGVIGGGQTGPPRAHVEGGDPPTLAAFRRPPTPGGTAGARAAAHA